MNLYAKGAERDLTVDFTATGRFVIVDVYTIDGPFVPYHDRKRAISNHAPKGKGRRTAEFGYGQPTKDGYRAGMVAIWGDSEAGQTHWNSMYLGNEWNASES